MLVVGVGVVVAYGNAVGEKGPVMSSRAQADMPPRRSSCMTTPFSRRACRSAPESRQRSSCEMQGQSNHNFTNTDLNVSTDPVKPGDVVTVAATVPIGTTRFVCTWHPGMVMEVIGQ